jgi:hypothetical protein
MKVKFFLVGFLLLFFFVGSCVYYFRFLQAEQAGQAAQAAVQTGQAAPEACSDACFKKVAEKLDKVLANQTDIISRLDDLDKLVRTRKVD